jgi:hypothetical protein
MPNQGGSHERHVKAGQQNHKNDDATRQASGKNDQNESQRGGKGNSAHDPDRAAEAGRKGGKH